MQLVSKLWERLVTIIADPVVILSWLDSILIIFLIFLVTRIIYRIIRRILLTRIKPLESLPDTDPKKQRAKTMVPLMENIVSYSLYGLAGVIALQEIGVQISAILAGAGVVGLAIGFGAPGDSPDSRGCK